MRAVAEGNAVELVPDLKTFCLHADAARQIFGSNTKSPQRVRLLLILTAPLQPPLAPPSDGRHRHMRGRLG